MNERVAHTPGPWEVDVRGREGNENDPWHCAIVGTAIGRHVVIADTLNCSCVFSPDDQRANAALIAAAPAMLAALKGLLFHFGNPQRDEWLNDEAFKLAKDADQRARAIIAKAEGRAP